ncbi:hypothetical protein, partial [Aeromonas veronii]|uniref:hypothetical protein n=1 Tax=Aeromonas veronii TaxID=654 RepID=UPI003BA01CC6
VALRMRILRFSLRKSSDCFRFSFGATSLGSWLISSACSAVLVGAHYSEPRRDDKGFFSKKVRSLRYQATTCFLLKIASTLTIAGFKLNI